MRTLAINNTRWITLPLFRRSRAGCLLIGEARRSVPFEIRRFYVISGVTDKRAVRGRHAHKKLRQAMFCLQGSCELHLDDGARKQKVVLKATGRGVLIGPGVWRELRRFSRGSVVLVVADAWYRKDDYITDYQEFLNYMNRT